MTDIFSREQFEAALPVDKETGERLWEPVDLAFSEYTYGLPVSDHAVILITSSIRKGNELCDDTGDNSIRAWIVDASDFSKPLAAKLVRWTARTRNWRVNLSNLLRELWKLAMLIEPCPTCGGPTRISVAKNGKPENAGRRFVSCTDRAKCGKFITWVDEVLK